MIDADCKARLVEGGQERICLNGKTKRVETRRLARADGNTTRSSGEASIMSCCNRGSNDKK